MKKALIISIFALTLSASFIACTTIRPIPEDLTAPQLLQEGQACFDNSDYKNAEAIFLATIDRYGDNTETYIEAKYELAHLYIKTRDYYKAYIALDEILEIYSYAMVGDLPASYKKLAQIEMDKIPPAKLEEYQKAKNN